MRIINKIPYLILSILAACSFHTESNMNPIMKIENDNLFNDYKLSDIVDSIQIIPLETSDTCLIGDCTKVLVDNQNIYVSDRFSRSLFVFDLNGKLKYSIKNIGKGPTEYLEIEDFCLLNNGNIAILDGSLKKIIFVNTSDLSLTEQKVPFYCDAIEYLKEGYLVFNGSSREDRIIIWNYEKKKRVNSFIKYDEKYNSTKTLKPLIKYKNSVYYIHEFKTYLERISIDKIEKCNYIDFGKYNLKGELLKQRFLGMTDIYVNPPNTASIYKYTETNSLIYFRFSIENLSKLPFCVFYSKKTKNKIILNNDYYTDDLTHYICPPMINTATSTGGLVSILLPCILLEKIDKERSKPDILKDKFRQMKEKIKGIKITDNPIVAIYYLKQF